MTTPTFGSKTYGMFQAHPIARKKQTDKKLWLQKERKEDKVEWGKEQWRKIKGRNNNNYFCLWKWW